MEIRNNIPLASYTTLKIGGAARFFCEAESEEDVLEAVKFAKEKNLSVFVLGGGSNILVRDKGFDGLVIKILNSQFSILNSSIECGAGCQLSTIVGESAKAGLAGLEWAAGLPGTVGGAIRGNAGCFGADMSEIVESVRVLNIQNTGAQNIKQNPKPKTQNPNSLQVTSYKLQDCKFSYRESVFKQNPNLIILSATLKLKKGSREESERVIRENLEKRRSAQPAVPCPGSFFKNPAATDKKLIEQFEIDTGRKTEGGKIPAGYLIERAGLKGKKIGGAMVSEEHANFIVNAGNATAENVVMLAAVIKTRVRNKYGIQLKEEVQMVGF